jgi:hypothetical protein
VSTITRRGAILSALGVPGAWSVLRAATASKEFWDDKFPEDWTKPQIDELLNNSPWSQPAAIHFDGGPGGAGGFAMGGYISPADRVRYEGSNAEKSPGTFHALVRWESAKPLCAAQKRTPDLASQYYILALTGDFPDEARPRDGEDAEATEQRLDALRSYTKLDRKGAPPIYLDRIQPISGGEMYYFPRLEPITPSNKEITFSTKLGPLEFKARFVLKDMLYRGKLEL